ncbi:hypothetical protein XSR1_20136 [Xenorhabdus szentirmaii DSM 16338]|uniref:Uncharacterized protein n=1 Tax=Xenorhabdus szentirmaii DSM 16338 TaxID=1427518 RepID=W1IUY4_9GAMM|nr:hypothetical protein XSR1_20136 [Xenorhabdus szentirmaii DSM 16338]
MDNLLSLFFIWANHIWLDAGFIGFSGNDNRQTTGELAYAAHLGGGVDF